MLERCDEAAQDWYITTLLEIYLIQRQGAQVNHPVADPDHCGDGFGDGMGMDVEGFHMIGDGGRVK